MRNEIEDLKQQAREYAKQQLKKQVKEAAKNVGQQIWSAIAPVLPYVIAAILILIVIVGCVDWDDVTASAASGGSSSGLESTSSTSWEQFKRFVLLNEGGTRVDEYGNRNPNGAYYIVEDDSWNNPTIGHGLCLKSSGSYLNVEAFSSYGIDSKKLADDYFNGIYGKVPVEICDSIWNDLLYAKYESIASQCQDLNLTEYQLYALTDVKYRRGNIDGFRDAYNSKWTSSDDKYGEDPSSESYSMDSLYSFFNNGFTNTSSGVYTRKKRQWILFKYGYYETLQEYWLETTLSESVDTSSLNGNDYGGTYHSQINGYTFIQYYQNKSSWSGDTLNGYPSTNLGLAGCNVTSNAIALSAITGDTITPRQINNVFSFASNDASSILKTSNFSKYADEIGITGYITNPTADALISYLKQRKVVILQFNVGYGNVNGWAITNHYVVCADYKKENGTDSIYIVNPARGARNATGWYQISAINVTGWKSMRVYYRK